MRGLATIAWLTWLEARRRRVVLVAVAGGLIFLGVYALSVGLIDRHSIGAGPVVGQRLAQLHFLTTAGLYVVNFLTIAVAILLPVDTISGEIDSGVMQTLASKPIARGQILLGKWLTYWLMTAAYLLLMAGGIAAIMFVLTGFDQAHVARALPLILLGATVMSAVTIAGGVRLTTTTNGMMAFAFYGIAFVAGWIEQAGAIAGSLAAQRIGTAISLASPADAMWRRAAYELQPEILRNAPITPFTSVSVPSTAMILWACAFVAAALLLSIRLFGKRPL